MVLDLNLFVELLPGTHPGMVVTNFPLLGTHRKHPSPLDSSWPNKFSYHEQMYLLFTQIPIICLNYLNDKRENE